jgi:acyl-CoA thioesterase I
VKSELKRRDFNRLAVSLCFTGVTRAMAEAIGNQKLLVIGDSLSAEYGIARGTGWVALLAAQLAKDKPQWQVINASISGDTTAGGLARLPGLLQQHQPQLVVIELGGNDGLRGFSLKTTENNLVQMVMACQKAKARVLLIGMQVPPNYGASYAEEFSHLFQRISRAHKTELVPFLLKGIADAADPTALFQADRIHPKAQAHPQILANVWPVLKKML